MLRNVYFWDGDGDRKIKREKDEGHVNFNDVDLIKSAKIINSL